jgi:transposase InsO family protein
VKKTFTASELEELAQQQELPGIPKSKRGINKKATKEQWQYEERYGNGGGRAYLFSALPTETQAALLHISSDEPKIPAPEKVEAVEAIAQIAPSKPETATILREKKLKPIPPAPSLPTLATAPSKPEVTRAWIEVIRAFEEFSQTWCNPQELKKEPCLDCFLKFFKSQEIVFPKDVDVYGVIKGLSRATLYRKLSQAKTGLTTLGDKRGCHRAGTGLIDNNPELQTAIQACVEASRGLWSIPQIRLALSTQYQFAKVPSEQQIWRYLDKLQKESQQLWRHYTDPDKAKSSIMPGFGSRSQNITEPNQEWQADSSPLDLFLRVWDEVKSEWKEVRHALVAAIDVATRRATIKVFPTSNAEAICLLLRNAITDWGAPTVVKTDNGKDYISARVRYFLLALGIDPQDLDAARCTPKSPEQKPFIERFIGTFQHDKLPMLPGYGGSNVGQRQRLRTGERLEVHLSMTVEEFQTWTDAWCAEYANTPHGKYGTGLGGRTPMEALAGCTANGWQPRKIENPRLLDFLLMESPRSKDGFQKVQKHGVQVGGYYYNAPELGDKVGDKIHVRLHPTDANRIYIWDSPELTRFLCEATLKGHPDFDQAQIAAEANALYKASQAGIAEVRKEARKLKRAIASNPHSLVKAVDNVKAFTKDSPHSSPALEAAAAALESLAADKPTPSAAALAHQLQELAPPPKQVSSQPAEPITFWDADYWFALWQRLQSGTVSPSELEWMVEFLADPSEGEGIFLALKARGLSQQEVLDALQTAWKAS